MNEQDRIRVIKERAEQTLFRIPGVHGIGIGHKHTKGEYTSKLSIKVYVIRKKPLGEISSAEIIPVEFEGVNTDVVETGPPQLSGDPDTRKYRPVRGGTPIAVLEVLPDGFHTVTSNGTLGFIARTTTNPSIIVGVTNHHVLAGTGAFTRGQAVGQTSPKEYSICSKCCSEIIGVVLDGMNTMVVDVALIRLNRKLDYYNQVQDTPQNYLITGEYSLQQLGIPASPYHVKKRGAATGPTKGTIDSIHATYRSNMIVTHIDVISIRPDSGLFNDTGDSGSAVLNTEGKIIGLLFAKDPTNSGFGYAFDIDVVKTQLSGINLPIEILISGSLNAKQTVPDTDVQANAYMVDAAQDETSAQTSVVETRLFQKVHDELLQTDEGQRYVGLFRRHQDEVRTLIDTNKRVATVWHRNGGPSLLREAIQVVQSPEQSLPTEIEGLPFMERINRISQAFKKYGSAALARDIAEYGAPLGQLGGQTYAQILARLRAGISRGSRDAMAEAL